MEHRRAVACPTRAGSLIMPPHPAPKRKRPAARAHQIDRSVPLATLQDFIDNGGQISIGRIAPIPCAAVANDDHVMYVAILKRKGESLVQLIERLDRTLADCLENETTVDEINGP